MLTTVLFLLALLCGAPAASQETPPAVVPPAATAPSDVGFVREFGRPGDVGSFRARFSRQGAGLVWLQATDHYVSLAASRSPVHGPADWLLLAANGGDHALRVAGSVGGVDPATALWTLDDVPDAVQFSLALGNGLVLRKTFRHDGPQRSLRVELALAHREGGAAAAAPGTTVPLQLLLPALVNPHEMSLLGNSSVAIAANTAGDSAHVAPAAGQVQELAPPTGTWSFVGNTNRFFAAFLHPLDEASGRAAVGFQVDTVPPLGDPDTLTAANTVTRTRCRIDLAVPAQGAETVLRYGLYLGPKSYRVFSSLADPDRFAPILDVDLNPPCCGIDVPGGRPMAKLLLRLLGWFQDLVGNWGLAIVMLTVLVRGLMAPLNFRMQKSMRAYGKRMAVLKPKIDELQRRHADDKAALQQAMLQLQREHKLMPPLGGCLPIFLTMPIYLGLFTALRTAYDVRQQPFFGWIDDLSRADALFELGFWPHEFNLLPLLWIAMLVWLTLQTPLPTDPQQRQMQSMMRYMPIMFGVFLYGYASALMVYMVTSMLWSLCETAIIRRILGPMDPNAAAMAPAPMM